MSFGNKNVGDIINYLIDSETSKPKIIKNYFEFVYYINDLRNVEILDVDDLIIQYKNYLLKLDLLNLIKDN
ncbi:Uncharacterised protein [Metamycoplasma alkalescens]|uniref:Uncharacterized protein n=1 Tax=Metamycoplasma alkalescens TaxID=45363 RepID=A0A3B0P1I7_9BACT|nr:Uncharacterised protein [Metamycoplasma alkalescens]